MLGKFFETETGTKKNISGIESSREDVVLFSFCKLFYSLKLEIFIHNKISTCVYSAKRFIL